MAFPVVAANNFGQQTSGTSHTINLPGSIAAGDLLIVMVAWDGTPTITWPSGWNQAANNLFAFTSTDIRLEGKQRVADGSEGSTITVTSSVSEGSSHVSVRITGQHATEPAVATTATGSSTNPNPPANNPANWDVEDTLWIAFAGHDCGGADDDDITAHPSSYTGIRINQFDTDAGGAGSAAAQRNNAVASEDPGAFTTPTSEAWGAVTIGIRPTGVLTGTAALTVPQPSIAASGTVVSPVTGTAALSVSQPAIAASGTVAAGPITGDAALTVPQPSLAASGTATIQGSAALAVAQPVIAASGTVAAGAITGTAALGVPWPSVAASGAIPVTIQPAGVRIRNRHRAAYRDAVRRAWTTPEGAVSPPAIPVVLTMEQQLDAARATIAAQQTEIAQLHATIADLRRDLAARDDADDLTLAFALEET